MAKKCINANSPALGLCHPHVKFLVSPLGPIAQNEFRIRKLGEYEIEFENDLGYETGDQMGSIGEKNQRTKISRYCPFDIFRCNVFVAGR